MPDDADLAKQVPSDFSIVGIARHIFPGALSGVTRFMTPCPRRIPGISPLSVMLSRRDVSITPISF